MVKTKARPMATMTLLMAAAIADARKIGLNVGSFPSAEAFSSHPFKVRVATPSMAATRIMKN